MNRVRLTTNKSCKDILTPEYLSQYNIVVKDTFMYTNRLETTEGYSLSLNNAIDIEYDDNNIEGLKKVLHYLKLKNIEVKRFDTIC